MSGERASLGDDIAFLRALAEGGGASQRSSGAAFLAGGLLYGLQCFVQGAQAYGIVTLSDTFTAVFVVGVTLVFLLVLAWILWHGRKAPNGGVAARAIEAAFSGAGTATVAMLGVFASIALREESLTIWLLFPCVVFALQGATWTVAWRLRRRAWLGIVAVGWLVSAVLLAATIGSPLYALVAGLALVLFMAVPGAIMLRPAQV